MSRIVSCLIAAALVIAAPTAASAAQRIYSYDPANAKTRGYVDNGLTFLFDRSFLHFRVKQILSTQANALADVEPAREKELGLALARILPPRAPERELYRINADGQGTAMIRAFCPGSIKGWLVFGPMRARQPLTVHALGDDPASGKARLCATLQFTFHGEWMMPVGNPRVAPAPPYPPNSF